MAVTKLLLMQEADKKPNIRLLAGKSNTILHKAVYNGNADFIRMLVEAIKKYYTDSDLDFLLDSNSLDEKIPLMCAVEDDNIDVADVLIESRATFPAMKNPMFLFMELVVACSNGLLDMVKFLISKKEQVSSLGVYLLTVAGENNHQDVVQYLMKETNVAAELEATTSHEGEGFTPLLSACQKGNKNAVQFLVDQGANVYAKDKVRKLNIIYNTKHAQASVA